MKKRLEVKIYQNSYGSFEPVVFLQGTANPQGLRVYRDTEELVKTYLMNQYSDKFVVFFTGNDTEFRD